MLYAIVAVICLILDQALKYWTSANIVLNTGSKELIPGVIHLANVHNTGAAFSMLEGARWFFVVLCLVFLAAVIYVLYRNIVKSQGARWALVIVLAGALGNCIDRVISGYVVDMFELSFKIFGFRFPVFNLADIFITVGGVLFCILFLLEPDEKKQDDAKAVKPVKAKPQTVKEAPVRERAERAEKPARPIIKRRQKVVIPDFPPRPRSEEPAIDPNDPFAEWERLASEKAEAKARPKAELKTKVEAEIKAEPAAIPETEQKAAAIPETERAPAPAVKEEEVSYDLDDILAEFRDL